MTTIDGIADVDGYAYIINGKVICFEKGIFDLSRPAVRNALKRMADHLYVKGQPYQAYGPNTICIVQRYDPAKPPILTASHIIVLPKETRLQIASILPPELPPDPDQEIIPVGNSACLIGKKLICLHEGDFDLSNPEDAAFLKNFAARAGYEKPIAITYILMFALGGAIVMAGVVLLIMRNNKNC